MRWLVVLLGILSAVPTVRADVMSGRDLQAACTQSTASADQFAICHGYIVGIADTMQGGSVEIYGWRACIDDKITVEAVVAKVRGFLGAHPEYLDLDADTLVARALADAYPC